MNTAIIVENPSLRKGAQVTSPKPAKAFAKQSSLLWIFTAFSLISRRSGRRRPSMARLTHAFFDRDTVDVAQALLGKYLVRNLNGTLLTGRIMETEAYIGRCDKACHAYNYRRTPRTETLFLGPGHAYIYFIYGMYTGSVKE